MAIVWSVVVNKVTVYGDQNIRLCTLTSNGGSYTAGGDTVAPSAVGLDYLDYADSGPAVSGAGTTAFVVNIIPGSGANANMKIQLFGSNGAASNPLAEFVGTPGAGFTIVAEFRGV